MTRSIAPLTDADEYLIHQTTNTFGAVAEPDHSWTEKVWMTLHKKDGSLQASFGLGKYTNRNIMDGFAGVQIGTQQRTIRASRVLRPNIEETAVGPLSYEIIEPYRKIRIQLAKNEAQPLQFDLLWTSDMPVPFEDRDQFVKNGRLTSDLVRYQTG